MDPHHHTECSGTELPALHTHSEDRKERIRLRVEEGCQRLCYTQANLVLIQQSFPLLDERIGKLALPAQLSFRKRIHVSTDNILSIAIYP